MFMRMPDDSSAEAPPAHPGEVGRRIEQRRRQLGLTREETAARAGVAVSYLEYVETSTAAIEIPTLARLADALRTSVSHLGGLGIPPGRGSAVAHPVPEESTGDERWARLPTVGIGRASSPPDGHLAVPVNFRVLTVQ